MLHLVIFVLVKRLLSTAHPPRRHLLLLILDQFVDFSLASFSRACIILGLDRHLRAETHVNSFSSRINRLEGLCVRTCRHWGLWRHFVVDLLLQVIFDAPAVLSRVNDQVDAGLVEDTLIVIIYSDTSVLTFNHYVTKHVVCADSQPDVLVLVLGVSRLVAMRRDLLGVIWSLSEGFAWIERFELPLPLIFFLLLLLYYIFVNDVLCDWRSAVFHIVHHLNFLSERYLERADFSGRLGHHVGVFGAWRIYFLDLITARYLRQDLDRPEKSLRGARVALIIQIAAKLVEIIFLLFLL